MSRNSNRRHLSVAIAAVLTILAGLLATTGTARAADQPRHGAKKHTPHRTAGSRPGRRDAVHDDLPVVLVHGAGAGPGCFGYDTEHYWRNLVATLGAMNWRGPIRSVLYYCGDTGPAGSIDLRHDGQYGFDTPIEIIAHNLAWWIYRTYSNHGQAVDIVGHSMGGLITRYAIARSGSRGWPPYLIVRQALTLSTPHGGIPGMDLSVCEKYVQCQEMEPGSAFLDGLQKHANSPQARGGTSWTEMGGGACDVIPASSTLSMRGADTIDLNGTAPTCYTHTSYLDDTHTDNDVPYTYHFLHGPSFTGLGGNPDWWIVHQIQR